MRLNKKKFFIRIIIPVLLVALIISVVTIWSKSTDTYKMEWGSIESKTVNAVVVRNETLVNGTDYGRIEYSVLEGQKVAADQQIAWVYKKEYVTKEKYHKYMT